MPPYYGIENDKRPIQKENAVFLCCSLRTFRQWSPHFTTILYRGPKDSFACNHCNYTVKNLPGLDIQNLSSFYP